MRMSGRSAKVASAWAAAIALGLPSGNAVSSDQPSPAGVPPEVRSATDESGGNSGLRAVDSRGPSPHAGNLAGAPIVFTQLPVDAQMERLEGRGGGTLRHDYGDRGRIVRLDPDGRLTVLTEGFSSACGCDVSFDGQRVLFSAKRNAGEAWNIWEMDADGSGARQITRDAGNCRSPAYQATLYTIVSTEPWYQVMFVSDAAGLWNEQGADLDTDLYSCRLDGSDVRRLTMNPSNDMDPVQVADGRVLMASWQRMHLRRGSSGRVTLFGVNIDGADYALYAGDQGRRIKHMPCVTRDGLVVFVEADQVGWDGAGQLASIAMRRHYYSHRPISRDPKVLYHSPSPASDGGVLVSRRPADGTSTHGIFHLDPHTGETRPIFNDPQAHDIHARVLEARPEPDGRSSVVDEKHLTGKFYCLNAYLTDPEHSAAMRPGLIQSLRVLEGVPIRRNEGTGHLPHEARATARGPEATANGMVPLVQTRLLGLVPVAEDGSFHLELPADVPVQLQTLDADGMALKTCGWIWAKPAEPRGCIGCHEDPELTPENRFVQALREPGVALTLPAEARRTVEFWGDVLPIINRRCVFCHAGGTSSSVDLRADQVGPFNRAYVSLMAPVASSGPDTRPAVGRLVDAGQARTSPLIWRLFGRNTSRPWDETYRPEQTLPMCPPPGAEPLTDGEKQTFVEWIDLGAHWDGIPGSPGLTVDLAGREAGESSE